MEPLDYQETIVYTGGITLVVSIDIFPPTPLFQKVGPTDNVAVNQQLVELRKRIFDFLDPYLFFCGGNLSNFILSNCCVVQFTVFLFWVG